MSSMTPVADIVRRVTFDVPEEDRRALESDIQAQLAGLPLAIADQDTYAAAKLFLPKLKQAEDKVLDFFRDMKDRAFKAHKAITAKEGESLKPIKAARDRLSRLIYDFEREQQRLRREAELAESKRLQEQQQAQALEEANALNDAGAVEMAEQVVEQAIAAPAPVVVLPSQAVAVQGVSIAQNWQWKFAGCGSGLSWDQLSQEERDRVLRFLPREYMRPDDKAITKIVKAMRGSTRIPGVEVFDAGSVRVRG